MIAIALVTVGCAGSSGGDTDGDADPAAGGQSPAASDLTIETIQVGAVGTVLGTEDGYTLYHLTTENADSIECTGECASAWPPLLVEAGSTPTTGEDLSGELGTAERPDGSLQITYEDMPLYTYSGDTEPGQAGGEGVQDVWFAVPAKDSAAGEDGGSEDGGAQDGGGGYGY